jgi:hypothetical protein
MKAKRPIQQNEKVDAIAWEIQKVLQAPFTGYLGEAMDLGGRLVTCQRILAGELIVETDTLRVLTVEQVEVLNKEG